MQADADHVPLHPVQVPFHSAGPSSGTKKLIAADVKLDGKKISQLATGYGNVSDERAMGPCTTNTSR